jgi:hypothetical protein
MLYNNILKNPHIEDDYKDGDQIQIHHALLYISTCLFYEQFKNMRTNGNLDKKQLIIAQQRVEKYLQAAKALSSTDVLTFALKSLEQNIHRDGLTIYTEETSEIEVVSEDSSDKAVQINTIVDSSVSYDPVMYSSHLQQGVNLLRVDGDIDPMFDEAYALTKIGIRKEDVDALDDNHTLTQQFKNGLEVCGRYATIIKTHPHVFKNLVLRQVFLDICDFVYNDPINMQYAVEKLVAITLYAKLLSCSKEMTVDDIPILVGRIAYGLSNVLAITHNTSATNIDNDIRDLRQLANDNGYLTYNEQIAKYNQYFDAAHEKRDMDLHIKAHDVLIDTLCMITNDDGSLKTELIANIPELREIFINSPVIHCMHSDIFLSILNKHLYDNPAYELYSKWYVCNMIINDSQIILRDAADIETYSEKFKLSQNFINTLHGAMLNAHTLGISMYAEMPEISQNISDLIERASSMISFIKNTLQNKVPDLNVNMVLDVFYKTSDNIQSVDDASNLLMCTLEMLTFNSPHSSDVCPITHDMLYKINNNLAPIFEQDSGECNAYVSILKKYSHSLVYYQEAYEIMEQFLGKKNIDINRLDELLQDLIACDYVSDYANQLSSQDHNTIFYVLHQLKIMACDVRSLKTKMLADRVEYEAECEKYDAENIVETNDNLYLNKGYVTQDDKSINSDDSSSDNLGAGIHNISLGEVADSMHTDA